MPAPNFERRPQSFPGGVPSCIPAHQARAPTAHEKPVWILSRYNADWRWLQNRPTNPWYPTARIFGQPSMGDWDSVMAEVGRELAAEIAKQRG